jgi:hypothetical protein
LGGFFTTDDFSGVHYLITMFDSVALAIIGIAGALLAGVVGHVLGQRAERQKQSLAIKAEMLKPIEEYLKGAEKMVGILGDTMASVALNVPIPINYSFDERRKASNFMAEKTNEVFGIVASDSLQTGRTKRLTQELSAALKGLDTLIKFQLLPRESELVDRSNKGTLTQDFLLECGTVKLQGDALLQKSYSLIAQIRTTLS